MSKNKKSSASANGATKNAIDGRAIAASAIEEMHDVHDDAKAFVEECRRKGRDPQEVVAFIAAREGILLGMEEPKDEDRKSLYLLLKEVLREAVSSFLTRSVYDDLGVWKDNTNRPVITCSGVTYGGINVANPGSWTV